MLAEGPDSKQPDHIVAAMSASMALFIAVSALAFGMLDWV